MSRRIVFESSAFADFNEWAKLDKKIYRKIVELIKDIDRPLKDWVNLNL
ncbi:type II toxin-antitoxin system YoeB family toxin [Microcoleus sp. A006_D1]